MRYLKVIFEDAALFRNNKMTKDFILLSRNNGICSRLEKQKENFENCKIYFHFVIILINC